jgi:plastocyanin
MALVTRQHLLVAAVALLLPACGGAAASGGSSGGGGAAAASPGPPAAITISAHDFGFSPAALTVAPGSTVTLTFTNTGSVKHNVTASTVNVNLDGDPGSTQTATFTAPQSGTIAFHCEYHPTQMTGTITVGTAAAAPSPASSAATTGGPSYGY